MEFGMFHQFPVVPGMSESDAFHQAFEQVDAAERYGLDAMWLAELHVDPARSALPSLASVPARPAEARSRAACSRKKYMMLSSGSLRARSAVSPT